MVDKWYKEGDRKCRFTVGACSRKLLIVRVMAGVIGRLVYVYLGRIVCIYMERMSGILTTLTKTGAVISTFVLPSFAPEM